MGAVNYVITNSIFPEGVMTSHQLRHQLMTYLAAKMAVMT
jgi:hypothetical protein